MPSKTRDLIAFAALSGVALCGLQLVINPRVPPDAWLCGDEVHFIPTVRSFAEGFSWEKLRTYEEMSTPLPFLLYAGWGQGFGTDAPTLRWANCLVGWLAVVAVFRLLGDTGASGSARWAAGVWFLAIPYVPYLSVFVYTDMPAVLTLALAWTAIGRRRWVTAAVWLAAALMCRQYLAFVNLGLTASAALAWRRGDIGRAVGFAGVAVASAVPLAALFAWWGGLHPANTVHHQYTHGGVAFHPGYLVLYSSALVIYLAPFAAYGFWARPPKTWEWVLGCATAVLIVPLPVRVSAVYVGTSIGTVGVFHQFARWVLGTGPAEQVPFAVGLGVAAIYAVRLARGYRSHRGAVGEKAFWDLQVLAFLAVMPWSYQHWEKY